MIYLKEGAQAALSTAKRICEHHQEILKSPPQGEASRATSKRVQQMLLQKAVQFEVWKFRVASLDQRMQNVINLVSQLSPEPVVLCDYFCGHVSRRPSRDGIATH